MPYFSSIRGPRPDHYWTHPPLGFVEHCLVYFEIEAHRLFWNSYSIYYLWFVPYVAIFRVRKWMQKDHHHRIYLIAVVTKTMR